MCRYPQRRLLMSRAVNLARGIESRRVGAAPAGKRARDGHSWQCDSLQKADSKLRRVCIRRATDVILSWQRWSGSQYLKHFLSDSKRLQVTLNMYTL